MPNHCTNNLTITGNKDEIRRFHTAIIQGEKQEWEQFRILDNLLPTPEELRNTVKGYVGEDKQEELERQYQNNLLKYGFKDWYDWSCANYGSKWSDYEGSFSSIGDEYLMLSFNSAWSPIQIGIENVSKQFPTLNFLLSWHEGGCAFLGGASIRNGETLKLIEGDYPDVESDDDYDAQYEKVSVQIEEIEKELALSF